MFVTAGKRDVKQEVERRRDSERMQERREEKRGRVEDMKNKRYPRKKLLQDSSAHPLLL